MNNVFTFGCRLNFWESEKINSFLNENKNYNMTVFNTCSVTNEAVKNTITNREFGFSCLFFDRM